MKSRTLKAFAVVAVLTLLAAKASSEADPLPSWNEGPAKQTIMAFVRKVTAAGTRDYVPPAERIATFDNDGTLWPEQPLYFQALFALDEVKRLAPEHPEWKEKEPFASLLRGDVKKALGDRRAILEVMAATHAGMTTDDFENRVRNWIATARHPVTKRPYTEMAYQPMGELLAYLRANGFKTFVVSGGGIDFMRPWAETVYGIPPEQIIGSSVKTKYELRDGVPVLVRLPEVNFWDDKEGKPIAIHERIGRRPIAAFGNSDGDLEMLRWTCSGDTPSLCLFVHHTDDKREWAYDRASPVGRLDKGIDEATARGWPIVDMKCDWKVVFPATPRPS